MNRSSMTAVIVEGEDREMGIIENMIRIYFQDKKYEFCRVPAGSYYTADISETAEIHHT